MSTLRLKFQTGEIFERSIDIENIILPIGSSILVPIPGTNENLEIGKIDRYVVTDELGYSVNPTRELDRQLEFWLDLDKWKQPSPSKLLTRGLLDETNQELRPRDLVIPLSVNNHETSYGGTI